MRLMKLIIYQANLLHNFKNRYQNWIVNQIIDFSKYFYQYLKFHYFTINSI